MLYRTCIQNSVSTPENSLQLRWREGNAKENTRQKSCRMKLIVAIIAHRGTRNKIHIGCSGTGVVRDLKYATRAKEMKISLLLCCTNYRHHISFVFLGCKDFYFTPDGKRIMLMICWEYAFYIPRNASHVTFSNAV